MLFRLSLVVLSLACSIGQAQTWPDPVAHDVVPSQTAGITHGPCLGGPADSGMRVWVRTAEPTRFDVIYSPTLPLNQGSRRVTGETRAAADNTGFVQLTGLDADTRYYYAIQIGDQVADLRVDYNDPWPSFRTLKNAASCPDLQNNPRGLFNFSFSVGCCASQDPIRSGGQYSSPPAFDTLLRQFGDEISWHIMNGDTIYEELRDGTRDGIRSNYKLYLRRGRSWSRLLRNVPTLFTYDDHEIGWDIHGCGEVGLGPGKWLIRDIGTSVWSEYCGWSNYVPVQRGRVRFGRAQLTAGSRQLVDTDADFSQLDLSTVSTLHVSPYTPSMRETSLVHRPADQAGPNAGVYGISGVIDRHTLELDRPARSDQTVGYSIGTHLWYDWIVSNCHFFALDTRGERTRPNLSDYDDPSRSILGEAQLQWLINSVRKSPADFIFIISPVPMVIYHTAYHVDAERGGVPKGDGFSSFVYERERLIEQLDRLPKPVLFLTGDVHASASVQVTDNVWEFLCGPMGSTNHPLGTCGGGTMPRGGDWTSQQRNVRVRWIGGFPDNVTYSRLRQPYFAVVQVNNVTPSPRPEGTGYQWSAFDAPQVIVRWYDGYHGRLAYAESVSSLVGGPPAGRDP